MMHETERQKREELAEEIWALSEAGRNARLGIIEGSKIDDAAAVLEKMAGDGLVVFEADRVRLTEDGLNLARSIIRRHRLAEMLLSQVLALDESVSDETACEMEHILSTAVTDSVCAFLGHPPVCPHGKPIPPGGCCRILTQSVPPLVTRLPDMRVGDGGRVVLVSAAAQARIERLGAFGIFPGSSLRLTQRRPTVVIEVGETTLAIDRDVAEGIYVRREREAAGA